MYGIFSKQGGEVIEFVQSAKGSREAIMRAHKLMQSICESYCLDDDDVKIYSVENTYHAICNMDTGEGCVVWTQKLLPGHLHVMDEQSLRRVLSMHDIKTGRRRVPLSGLRDCVYLVLFNENVSRSPSSAKLAIDRLLKECEQEALTEGLTIEYQASKRPATCTLARMSSKEKDTIKNGELRIGFPAPKGKTDWFKIEPFFDAEKRDSLSNRKGL